MKRIRQKKATDCFSACLASLLEVPLETVPHFWTQRKTIAAFYAQAQRWLAKRHGLTLVTIVRKDGVPLRDLFAAWSVPARFIATVPIHNDFHSVVVALYADGPRVVWDPGNPPQADLKNANDFSFLTPLFRKGAPCRQLTKNA